MKNLIVRLAIRIANKFDKICNRLLIVAVSYFVIRLTISLLFYV